MDEYEHSLEHLRIVRVPTVCNGSSCVDLRLHLFTPQHLKKESIQRER